MSESELGHAHHRSGFSPDPTREPRRAERTNPLAARTSPATERSPPGAGTPELRGVLVQSISSSFLKLPQRELSSHPRGAQHPQVRLEPGNCSPWGAPAWSGVGECGLESEIRGPSPAGASFLFPSLGPRSFLHWKATGS